MADTYIQAVNQSAVYVLDGHRLSQNEALSYLVDQGFSSVEAEAYLQELHKTWFIAYHKGNRRG